MQPLKFDALQQNTADFAFGTFQSTASTSRLTAALAYSAAIPIDTLPDTVKNDILAQIRTYIVSQIDESGNVSPTGRR